MAVFVTISYYYLLFKGEIEDSDKVCKCCFLCSFAISLWVFATIAIVDKNWTMSYRHLHGYLLSCTLAMFWRLLQTFGFQNPTEHFTCVPWSSHSHLSSDTWAGVLLPSMSMAASRMTSCKCARWRSTLSCLLLNTLCHLHATEAATCCNCVWLCTWCRNDMEQPSGMMKTAAALMAIVAAIFMLARVSLVPKHSKAHSAWSKWIACCPASGDMPIIQIFALLLKYHGISFSCSCSQEHDLWSSINQQTDCQVPRKVCLTLVMFQTAWQSWWYSFYFRGGRSNSYASVSLCFPSTLLHHPSCKVCMFCRLAKCWQEWHLNGLFVDCHM